MKEIPTTRDGWAELLGTTREAYASGITESDFVVQQINELIRRENARAAANRALADGLEKLREHP